MLNCAVSDYPKFGPALPRGASLNVKNLSNEPHSFQDGSWALVAGVEQDKLNDTEASIEADVRVGCMARLYCTPQVVWPHHVPLCASMCPACAQHRLA